MIQNNSDSSGEMAGLLERLACGELDEPSRGRVLRWLEEEPARWRLCGVAFLEAQTWTQALERLPASEPRAASPAATAPDHPPQNGRHRRTKMASRAVLAVSLMAAFGLGMVVHIFAFSRGVPIGAPVAADRSSAAGNARSDHDKSHEPASGEPILAEVDVQAGGFGTPAPIHIPVVPADQEVSARNAAQIPEYLQQQWERRGYKVSFERRYVFARLPGGQKVVVPVEQFHVNPVRLSMN